MEISELQLALRITCHCQDLCDSQSAHTSFITAMSCSRSCWAWDALFGVGQYGQNYNIRVFGWGAQGYCSTRTDCVLHFAAFWSCSYQITHRVAQYLKFSPAFALFYIRTAFTPSKLILYVLLVNVMQIDKMGYSQSTQAPMSLCILWWAPVKTVNILPYLITLNFVTVNCMCSLSHHNKFLYSHGWKDNVYL